MFTPPNPGIPSSFLSTVAALGYDATHHAFATGGGALVYPAIVQGATGGNAVDWQTGGADASSPIFQITSATFSIITGGVLRSGQLLFGGVLYDLQAQRHASDGSLWCEAVAA